MDQLTNPLPVASPQPSFPKWPIIALFSFLLGITSVLAYQKYLPSGSDPVGPSPLVSPKLEAKADDPTANWKTYINKANNYQLLFPPDWTLDDIANPVYPEIIPPDEGSNNEGRIVIMVNVSSDSLNQFMAAINPSTGGKNSDTYLPVRQIQISGENGILTKGGCCGFFGQHAFFQHQGKLFQLTLKGTIDDPQVKFQSVFDQILSTFKFLGTETGVCQPTFPVETNTQEMTANQNYSFECTFKKTAGDCLLVDIYNRQAKDFSQPDGESDCRWVILP